MLRITRPANWKTVKDLSLSLATELRNSIPNGTFFIRWDAIDGPEIFGFVGEPLDEKTLFVKITTNSVVLGDVPEQYKNINFALGHKFSNFFDFQLDVTQLITQKEDSYV